jgi:uncharacterized membrane protein
LESLIGSHWLNRIGIIAVLVGVSLFLRYAFESKWVGPVGRVSLGLLAGIAVIIWSEWFRVHAYPIFSFSLKALGLGMLYLSLWASFQVYDQISWVVAFLAMITVTASTIAMALWQEAEILALFALVGGFATPLLLYTGENRELSLFHVRCVAECSNVDTGSVSSLAPSATGEPARHCDFVFRVVRHFL